MALTAIPKRFCQFRITAADTDFLVYTMTEPKGIIKEIILWNFDNQDREVSVAIVPSGETLGPKHYFFLRGQALGQESNIFTGLATVLEQGDRIYVNGNYYVVDKELQVQISGVEFTEIV
ncbi:MAG: hypothetical protein U9Q40_05665 [Campylobacterota bacterium]|nr:hypothetical protein [Campylobacterota bacterium]